MKKPVEPIKPRKPSAPLEFFPPEKRTYDFYSGANLKSILDAIGDVDPDKVYFDYSCSEFYGSTEHDFSFEWCETSRTANPKYAEQLEKYNSALAKYRKDMIIYRSSLKEYNSLNKQYLQWFHTNELKKLKEA